MSHVVHFLWACRGMWVLLVALILWAGAHTILSQDRLLSQIAENGRKELFVVQERVEEPKKGKPDRVCLRFVTLSPMPEPEAHKSVRYCSDKSPAVELRPGDLREAWRTPDDLSRIVFSASKLREIKNSNNALFSFVLLPMGLFIVYNLFQCLESYYTRRFGDKRRVRLSGIEHYKGTAALRWHDDETGRKGETIDRSHTGFTHKLGQSVGTFSSNNSYMTVYRAPVTGRYWWEYDLPNPPAPKPPKTRRKKLRKRRR